MHSADGDRQALPLEGLRIIDISTYVAGPSGGMALAQLGADVIRIDPIGGATDTARLPLDRSGTSLYWAGLNKGKRSVEIDTRTEEGRSLVMALLADPHEGGGILLTNAVGQGWLDHEEVMRHRPDVIQVRVEGLSGGSPAVDYTVNCEVGLPYLTGPPDLLGPVNHVLPAWDLLTGLHVAVAVLAAERHRTRTGTGGYIPIALADVAVATMCHLGFIAEVVANGTSRLRQGNYLYGSFGCDFETADGHHVMVVALTKRHWQKLVDLTEAGKALDSLEEALGIDFSVEEVRFRYQEVIAALLRPWFKERSVEEVAGRLDDGKILWGRYRGLEDLVRDPESLLGRSSIVSQIAHPGIGLLPTPRSVAGFSGVLERSPAPAPALGAQTDEVLSEILGVQSARLQDLRERGVIGGSAGG